MKVLIAFLIGMFVVAAFPRWSVSLRRRPILILGMAVVVAASFTSLRVIGV
ncbi:MAG: hypothetical protein JWM12_2212 [Ilumatobacteraceae bacterium]|jgi:hypothetical protein|nr:hypothetical protein [Ilumatobacteraceae bacterium]